MFLNKIKASNQGYLAYLVYNNLIKRLDIWDIGGYTGFGKITALRLYVLHYTIQISPLCSTI